MHIHSLQRWQHGHRFHIAQKRGERNTRWVIGLTLVVMILEIAAGIAFGSMALLADGWHMGTHVAALGITMFAYAYARRHTNDPRYSFGTGKVGYSAVLPAPFRWPSWHCSWLPNRSSAFSPLGKFSLTKPLSWRCSASSSI